MRFIDCCKKAQKIALQKKRSVDITCTTCYATVFPTGRIEFPDFASIEDFETFTWEIVE